MSELILRFHDEAIDNFDWLVSQGVDASQQLQWSTGSEAELNELIKSHQMPVIFVIPQQCALMTHFDLPGKESRQLLSSIEFQIEDQLGEDIDLQHFAIGDITDNRVPIVVVKKSIMQRCQAIMDEHNISPVKIIPELFLCPWSAHEGEVSVLKSQSNVIVRYGYFQGIKCDPNLLKTMLGQLGRSISIDKVTYIDFDNIDDISIDSYDSTVTDLTLNHLDDSEIVNFDLRQREFKRSSMWGAMIGPWKSVAVMLIAFFVIFSANKFTYLYALETQLSDIKQQQYEVMESHLSPEMTKDDDLKKALIEMLKQSKGSENNKNFISQLGIFTQAKQKYSSINIGKINYQQSRLNINIDSTQLNDIEALVETLESSPLPSKLENLTIKPELVSGRLVLGL